MTSAINPANPVHGNPTTQSVRDNFAIAHQEISDLQALVASLMLNMPYLPLGGATMTGPLQLVRDPQLTAEAATKAYVDAVAARVTDLEKQRRAIGTTSGINRAVKPLAMLSAAFQPLDDEMIDGARVAVVGSGWASLDDKTFTVEVANRALSQFYLVEADTSAETVGAGAGAIIWLEPSP